MTSETAITWSEDGKDISGEIVSVSATDLVLRLNLVGGVVEERYTAAPVPYVCADLPA
jgi:hypothetical protein